MLFAEESNSTFAWYKTNQEVNVNAQTGIAAGSVSVGASTASSVNGFTITPATASASGNIAYTDSTGATYVSIPKAGGGYTTKAAETSAPKAVAIALSATVTYSGDLTAKADVEALWAATVTKVRLTVACSAVGGSTVAGTAATTDIRGVTSAAATTAGNLYIEVNDEDFTWSDATTTASKSFGTVYVALTGSDSLVVDAENLPTYTLQINSSYTGA